MRLRPSRRRGATLIESAVIFLVLLTLIVGMLDLGMALMHSHLLTDAARHVARQASVRGSLADVLGTWGPETVGPRPASDEHMACVAARNVLPGFQPDTVTVRIDWPDGGCEPGMRVRVTLTAPYPFIVPHLWGGAPIVLQAVSTAVITH